MVLKNKPLLVFVAIILIVVLGYFVIGFNADKKIVSQLPQIPNSNIIEESLNGCISKAFKKASNEPSSNNIGALGMVYHANNFIKEAETCYQLAITQDSKAWKWNYYLGCLKRDLGNSEEAVLNFKQIVKLNPKSYMALYYLGEGLQQLDSTKKAEQILKQISELNKSEFVYKNTKRSAYFPLPLYAKLQLSKLYNNDSRTDLAEKELKSLITEDITFGPAYRQLSNLYAQTGNQDLSTYYSDRSNDLNIYMSPVDTLIDQLSLHSKSEAYLLKQIDDAIRSSNSHWALELVNQGLEHIPNSKYLISKAIKHYMDMDVTKKALPLISKHLNFFKSNYQELIEVGVGFANKGFKKEALQYFSAAEKVEDVETSSKATLAGMYYEKLGMKDRALKSLNTLLDKYANNPDVLSAGIFLFLQFEDMPKVNKYLSYLKKKAPLHKDVHVFNAILAQRNGDYKKAAYYYERALKNSPDKKFIVNYLRKYYNENEDWDKAFQLYKTYLENNPNSSDIQEAYGSLLLSCPNKSLRDLGRAKEFSERAFINKVYSLPTKLKAGRSYAISLFELNEQGRAIYYLSETIKIAKRAGAAKSYVRELESIMGDFRKIMASR